jgi:hypothetical protein
MKRIIGMSVVVLVALATVCAADKIDIYTVVPPGQWITPPKAPLPLRLPPVLIQPTPRQVPPGWVPKEFNGMRFYVIPIDPAP